MHKVKEPIDLGGRRMVMTTSIGISLYPRDGGNTEELLRHADLALYQSKGSGRNVVHFFNPHLKQKASFELQLEEDLAVAGGGGAGIAEGPRGLERGRQVHGGAGDRWAERHRTQRLLPGAGPVPRAGGALAAGIAGCQREAGADPERTEGAGEAPRPGPREIKWLQKELRKKEKALAEAAALLLVTKKMQALWGEAEED